MARDVHRLGPVASCSEYRVEWIGDDEMVSVSIRMGRVEPVVIVGDPIDVAQMLESVAENIRLKVDARLKECG